LGVPPAEATIGRQAGKPVAIMGLQLSKCPLFFQSHASIIPPLVKGNAEQLQI
jgi:hypothetical protein